MVWRLVPSLSNFGLIRHRSWGSTPEKSGKNGQVTDPRRGLLPKKGPPRGLKQPGNRQNKPQQEKKFRFYSSQKFRCNPQVRARSGGDYRGKIRCRSPRGGSKRKMVPKNGPKTGGKVPGNHQNKPQKGIFFWSNSLHSPLPCTQGSVAGPWAKFRGQNLTKAHCTGPVRDPVT